MNYEFEPLISGKPTIITTLNGIGDLCWCAVKLANLKKVFNIPKMTIKMHMAGDHRDTRAQEFIKRFDFVDFVVHSKFPIHKNPISYNGRINYIDNGYVSSKSEYTFIVNPYIEWEGRIENIFPDVPCAYNFFDTSYVSIKPDISFARNMQKVGQINGQKRVGSICLHLGCKANNTHNGMNRLEAWTIKDWAGLARRLRYLTDLPIYILGAKYDSEYALALMEEVDKEDLNLHNMCGKTTTTQMIEVLKQTSLVVSFASGLGIASTYLGTPTVMFWMPEDRSVSPFDDLRFSNSFATNWVPPYLIGQTYYPAYYFKDTLDSVFEACDDLLEKSLSKF